ncbi:hypothetical protein [Adonisia turfae]|uniref:Uncharacterized protein n=1 Tax=Adonisia turfae CCMR0081 TaxID=2292702 RepID=A0A6M0RR23_9CYAN|nr:hypothetical protein [Adonisia turfae]NEZ58695.1 hypothetical protein [Adonisia turfae CCMR0081]
MKRLPKPHTCRTQQAQAARHDYLEISRQVIGEPDIDYIELYQRFIVNEWAAIKLDDSVALTALRLGKPAMNVAITLLQGPFIQYQVYEKDVIILAMVRYAKYTVRDAFKQFKQQPRYLPQQKQSASAVTS